MQIKAKVKNDSQMYHLKLYTLWSPLKKDGYIGIVGYFDTCILFSICPVYAFAAGNQKEKIVRIGVPDERTRSVKAWMVKVAGLTISWSNDGSGVSSTRKHIWLNTTISEKQGRLLGNMCIHTTLNVVIPHSIIRHRHPAIIQSCYWMIM